MLNWKAREIDERGEQLLLLLTADDAQCFHSEDEDIPQVPMALTSSDVTAAAAAAAPASESTNAFQAARPSASCATANLCSSSGRGKGRSRNIRTRPHVFRSQLANRLIHLLKPFSSHAAVGAHSDADAEGVLEGPHQVSAKLAQRVLQRVDLQPLVRVDILQTIAMVQQTSARRHLKFSQRTAGCASSDPLAEQTNAQQLPLQLSSHSEVCTHAAPVHSTSISPCPPLVLSLMCCLRRMMSLHMLLVRVCRELVKGQLQPRARMRGELLALLRRTCSTSSRTQSKSRRHTLHRRSCSSCRCSPSWAKGSRSSSSKALLRSVRMLSSARSILALTRHQRSHLYGTCTCCGSLFSALWCRL